MRRKLPGRPRSLIEPDVLAVVGVDRLILDNTSRYGLHRRHVIRYGDLPDANWLESAPKGVRVDAWAIMDDFGIGHLWFCWKDKTT